MLAAGEKGAVKSPLKDSMRNQRAYKAVLKIVSKMRFAVLATNSLLPVAHLDHILSVFFPSV